MIASAAASAVAVAVVVGLIAAVGHGDPDSAPPPMLSQSPTASSEPALLEPDALDLWDPFTLASAPLRRSVLPEHLAPPELPPSVLDAPMGAAVLAWSEPGADVRLLDDAGRWRCVPGTARPEASRGWWNSNPVLSGDGSQVALATEAGIRVVDVRAGTERFIGWSGELQPPWDVAPVLHWLPGDVGFAVFSWNSNQLVDLDGTWRTAPYDGRYLTDSIAIDPAGPILQHRWKAGELAIWDGDGASAVSNDQSPTTVPFANQGQRFVAGHGLIGYTTGALGAWPRGGPVVADSATGEILAYAPIRDRHAIYSDNGQLTAKGFLDEDTVLLLVTPMDFKTMEPEDATSYLVAWSFRTGDFERIAEAPAGRWTLDIAPALVE